MPTRLTFGTPTTPLVPGPTQPVGFGTNLTNSIGNFGSPQLGFQPGPPGVTGGAGQQSAVLASSGGPVAVPTTAAVTPEGDPNNGIFGTLGRSLFDTDADGNRSLNLGNIGSLAEIIGSFGNVFNGFASNRLAKDALNFQKQAFNTNLGNQTASFNLALEDRARSRFSQEGRSQEAADRFVETHRLGA